MAQICKEIHEWIEEKIEKPIDDWVEKEVRKCKKKKCKKWCLCCNKWFCWIETILVKVVKWVIVTVGKWVIRVVCEIVNIAIDVIGGIVGLILALPIIGRLIRQIWSGFIDLIWRIIGLFGVGLDILGFDWEKNLRVCFIILADGKGPLTTPAMLDPTIQSAIQVYKNAANIKLIVEDIYTVVETDRWSRNLDVSCEVGAWTDDLLLTGSNFELLANTYCFDGAGRRLLGFLSPVVVFFVREIKGKRGCSLGPFSDYVTIEAGDPGCLAHEIAHASYPWTHHNNPTNLLYKSCNGTQLKKWQKILIRNSRHVSYL